MAFACTRVTRSAKAFSLRTGFGTARWAEYTVWISWTPGVASAARSVRGLTGGVFSAACAGVAAAAASPADASIPAASAPDAIRRLRAYLIEPSVIGDQVIRRVRSKCAEGRLDDVWKELGAPAKWGY